MSKDKNKQEPVALEDYDPRRKFKTNKDGSITMDNEEYVSIPQPFAKKLVDLMKNGSFYESIINFDGADYMRKDKFEAYEKLAKVLSQTK